MIGTTTKTHPNGEVVLMFGVTNGAWPAAKAVLVIGMVMRAGNKVHCNVSPV